MMSSAIEQLTSYQTFVGILATWFVIRVSVWLISSFILSAKLNSIKNKKTFKYQTIEQILSNSEADRIASLSLDELAQDIRTKKVSSEAIVRLYCERAQKAHKDDAIQQAKSLDKYLNETGKTKGPLHGIPFSVKDCLDVKGRDSTWGIMKRCFQPATEDAVCVQLLKDQGAIPFVKTNLSQLTFSWESSNPVFGAVNNPWNLKNSPGGSSGGEAALIAARATPFGVGTDIGGSVRIPAHFCGISGFKPTVRRVSNIGEWTPYATESLLSTMGPMGRSARDLLTVTQALLHPRVCDLDPTIPYKPLDVASIKEKRKMKIGFFTQDGVLKPHAACVRAIEEITQKLKQQGHEEVVPIEISDGVEGNNIFSSLLCGDGFLRFDKRLDGEKIDHTIPRPRALFLYPWLTYPLILWSFISSTWALTRDILSLPLRSPLSAIDLEDLQAERIRFRERVAKEWKDLHLDFVICPVSVLAALPHHGTDLITPGVTYTSLVSTDCHPTHPQFNILDFPAGVVPATIASREDEKRHTRGLENMIDLGIKLTKLEKSVEGSPIGVQVVSLPYQEEKCLQGMLLVEEVAGFSAKPTWETHLHK